MADSEIVVSGLAATGGVGQIAVLWSVTEASCLPYLHLDKVEIWAATSNNRANAVKVGEVLGTQWVHAGLGRSTSRRYWIRPRDASGNFGEWFPVSATAGILGTTTNSPPSASVVSDISPDLGNINAGIVTGALIRTAPSGPRVEINSEQNSLLLFQSSSVVPVAQLRAQVNNTALTLSGDYGPAPVLNADNAGNGPAARLSGRSTNPAVLDVENTAGGSGRDGARIHNSGSGGGAVFLGRAASNGGYAVYMQRGGIGPFTGQHDALITKGLAFDIGDIMIDDRVIARNGVDDTLTTVFVSCERGQKGAVGIISRSVPLDATIELAGLRRSVNEKPGVSTPVMRFLAARYDLLTVNSVGEGQINVCGRNGNISKGDLLITSSMAGKAERQDDDVIRTITVARAREDVIFDHPDQWRRVACIYLCG